MSEARILHQIATATDIYDDWKRLELFAGDSAEVGIHIACMVEPFLGYILEGKKTVESRFSKPLIPPYQRVAVGDVVLLKAGPIAASFRVATIEFIELNNREFNRLVTDYSQAICADEEFWEARAKKRYATLLGISDVRRLTPLKVDKQDRRGWMVLREPRTKANAPTAQLSDISISQPTRYVQNPLFLSDDERCAGSHLFRPPGDQAPGACLQCGNDVVDWERMHKRNPADWQYAFSQLSREGLRIEFWRQPIDHAAVVRYEKNSFRLRELAVRRLRQSVSKVYGVGPDARPYRDGYQTPKRGDILYYAQHSLACCCRRCIRYWHGIPYGRVLKDDEIEYFTELIMRFVAQRMAGDLRQVSTTVARNLTR